MDCKNIDAVTDTDIYDAKKMYLHITKNTIIVKTAKMFCNFKFRKIAELFYFVTFPLLSGYGDFYINNICKTTVNN